MNGSLAGPVGELVSNFPLNGGENQALIGILRCCADKGRYMQLGFQCRPADQGGPLVSGQGDGYL